MKKGAKTEMILGNDKLNFPPNIYCGTEMKWHQLLNEVRDMQKDSNAQFEQIQKIQSITTMN